MKALTSYVDAHREEIVKPLLSILKEELKRSERDVNGNITHIRNAAENGIAGRYAPEAPGAAEKSGAGLVWTSVCDLKTRL